MRPSSIACVVATLLFACGAESPLPPPKTASFLPLRTLRLYETGVGYFERSGEATSASSLPVPAGHLDDALKSLVIIDGGSRNKVGGLSFPTSVSRGMARALSGLPDASDEALGYPELLRALKGAELEVVLSSRTLRGRLMEVTGAGGAAPASPLRIVFLSQRGELEDLPVSDILRVRPLDQEFAARMGTMLDALGPRSAQTDRPLQLFGDLHGPVTFGYVTETPTWRCSYRLVTGEGGRSALQGWALLHNDTDESWARIKLELVNGRPDAFLFPLAAPRYLRRALVHPADSMSTVPQLLHATADTLWGEPAGDGVEEEFGVGGVGLGGGGGSVRLGHTERSSGQGATTGASALLEVGNLAATAQASGVEAGALFRYVLRDPLTLGAHASALVPFLDMPMATALSSFADEGSPESVRSGTQFINTTGQTLPAGPIAFFAAGGFAGESSLPRLKPDERRFVTFAADLDVAIKIERSAPRRRTARVVFVADRVEEHFLETVERTVELEVRHGEPRDLYLSLAIGANGQIQGADRVDFDKESGRPMALFHLAPGQTKQRVITTVEGKRTSFPVQAIKLAELSRLGAEQALTPSDRAVLAAAMSRRDELDRNDGADKELGAVLEELQADVARLREDLKAASGEKGSGGEGSPIVRRLLAAEDRLSGVQSKRRALGALHRTLEAALRTELARLPSPTPETKGTTPPGM